jgi:NTE family protein
MREMRAIAFVTRLIDKGSVKDCSLKRMRIHAVVADEVMQKLSVASKLNADWEFLTHLRDDGRGHADAWLKANFARIGQESTVDIEQRYL